MFTPHGEEGRNGERRKKGGVFLKWGFTSEHRAGPQGAGQNANHFHLKEENKKWNNEYKHTEFDEFITYRWTRQFKKLYIFTMFYFKIKEKNEKNFKNVKIKL